MYTDRRVQACNRVPVGSSEELEVGVSSTLVTHTAGPSVCGVPVPPSEGTDLFSQHLHVIFPFSFS